LTDAILPKENWGSEGGSTLMKFRTQGLVFCAARPAPLAEGRASEADIARATATLLERSQFSQRRPDAALSSRFLDLYLDTLDGAHLLFTQGDLAEFARFRSTLAQMALRDGDTHPAHLIYARYLRRLAEQVDFATNLLHAARFDFAGQDSWAKDRHDQPAPPDLAAAQEIWREEVREEYLREELAGSSKSEIAPSLARRYARLLQTMRRLKPEEVLGLFLNALARVYDPHSNYFGPEEAEDFDIEMNLSFVGIGATLGTKDGYCQISDLLPGGPAARSGLLQPGDRLVTVAQSKGKAVDVVDMPLPQLVELIRGPKGSSVKLTIIPAGGPVSARKTISLVRDEIKLADQQAKAAIIDMPQTAGPPVRIGLIDLPSFYNQGDQPIGGATADTAQLIKKLEQAGARGLILDLRHNGGGSLEEAIQLAGLFIPPGPVVQTLGPEGDVDIGTAPEAAPLYAGPLVVLTSRMSASASEIVAGALQDYGRALLVGDTSTFGKGTVQTIVPLSQIFHQLGLGEVKITIRKFYRPSGASTQLKGVAADLVLPSETDLREISEAKLPDALPWDILPPTAYTNLNMVQPVLATLREKSRARVAADPIFRLVREKMALENKYDRTPWLSLNESVRREQKKQFDQLEDEMKKILREQAARNPPMHHIGLTAPDTAARPSSPLAPPAVGKGAGSKANKDFDLREAENILIDYIRALPARPAAEIVAGAKP
jgi:carboxyl-terminal processing protease